MNQEVAKECAKLSADEKITFPEVVTRLDKAGIESYLANLLAPSKTYFEGNETFAVSLNIKSEIKVASTFNPDQVVQAIRASQAKQIGYQEFLRRIMDAGVIFYIVFIKGRKVIYFGRNGDQHVENFPSK